MKKMDNKNEKVFASCHNHSCYSDAAYSPEKLVELAHGLGHGGIILTDHDTSSGNYFINKAARKVGMKSIFGCEFSAKGFHILGFDFNPDNKNMKELLEYCSSIQTSRSEILFKWGLERGTLRDGCTWQDVRDDFPYNDYICCEQIFVSMLKRGIYTDAEYNEFRMPNFSYTLGLEDKVREITKRTYLNPERVIKTILEAGGVPVLAHPHKLSAHVNEFLNMGIKGFECYHPLLCEKITGVAGEFEFYKALCEEKGLYKTGGSDHHGVLGGNLEHGDYEVPDFYSGISEEDFMNLYERKLG